MPKLWHRDEWYFPISLTSMAEQEFSNLLIQNSTALVPNAWIVPFSKTIYSREGSSRGDLAIIDKSYREWFVVEVEMLRHNLHGHVLPQVRTLRDGYYGPDEAEYLIERNPGLDPQRVRNLLLGTSPHVVVIADQHDDTWRPTLEGAGISFVAMQVFKSPRNDFVFSVDGGIPRRPENVVTLCSYNAMLPRQLLVDTPGALEISNGERLIVMWEGRATEWVRMDVRDSCYLRTRGPVTLRAGLRYALVRLGSGALAWRSFGKGEKI